MPQATLDKSGSVAGDDQGLRHASQGLSIRLTSTLESRIQENGHRLAIYASSVYRAVQLWEVPASLCDPDAYLIDISSGAYVIPSVPIAAGTL